MAENEKWERELITKLATAALKEQRRARLWGIFFKLLTFAYITVAVLLAFDWKGRTLSTAGPVIVNFVGMAPGVDIE